MWLGSSAAMLVVFIVALIVVAKAFRVVPQQHAWVVERLGPVLFAYCSRASIS